MADDEDYLDLDGGGLLALEGGEGEGDEGFRHEETDDERLMQRFNATINDLERSPETAPFIEPFTSLYEIVLEGKQRETSLQTETQQLRTLNDDQERRLIAAKQLATSDAQTIDEMRTQLEHAWQLADAAHNREQNSQEVITMLRKNVDAVNTELDMIKKMTQGEQEDYGQVSKEKDKELREKEMLLEELSNLNNKLSSTLEYQAELERKNSTADLKITQISGQLEEYVEEVEKYRRAKFSLELEVSRLQDRLQERNSEIEALNSNVVTQQKQIQKLEVKRREDAIAKDKVVHELDTVNVKNTKLTDDYQALHSEVDGFKQTISKKMTQIKLQEDEIIRYRNDYSKVATARDGLEKRVVVLSQDKSVLQEERSKLRLRIAIFEKEIEMLKRQLEADRRSLEEITRERDMMAKAIVRHEAVAKDLQKLIRIQQISKKKLEEEVDSLTQSNNRFTKLVTGLERERDRLASEKISLNLQIDTINDEVKVKKAEIAELSKELIEHEHRYKEQQNAFDMVRAEKNALDKALLEATIQGDEFRKKIKITMHQIEQLKEDISAKEQHIIKEENILKKVMKEKENIKVELNVAQDTIKSLKSEIAERIAEERRLHKTITDNERTIKNQSNDIRQLMNDRDILGSQVVRRNDEIALLHEKIRILQTTLQRGQSHYEQRVEDIKLLKIEIKRLRQEKNLMNRHMGNSIDFRQEVILLERDLTKERLKCRALEDELQNPLNVHRWRKLEGSDPDTMDLLQKIQLLQKRLIKKSTEAVERDKQLKHVETLYENLKKLLAHQPGPAIQEELNKTQRALKLKGDKLKCLVSELNMAELTASEHKRDLERVKGELNDLKKRYYAEKKTAQKQIQQQKEIIKHSIDSGATHKSSISQLKCIGGGFRTSVDVPPPPQ